MALPAGKEQAAADHDRALTVMLAGRWDRAVSPHGHGRSTSRTVALQLPGPLLSGHETLRGSEELAECHGSCGQRP